MKVGWWVPRLLVALLLAAAALALTMHREQLEVAALNSWIAQWGAWAPVAHVGLYALAAVSFVPGAIFSVVGGVLFGPFWGSIWNLLGATLGATLAFLAARYVAADWVQRRAGGRLKRLIDGVEAEGWRFVALVRLIPLFPFNLSNYAFGLTRIPLLQYVLASLICMAPGATAYTWLGHAGRGALAGETGAIRYGLLALGLLAAIAFVPGFIRRMRDRSKWIEPGELKRWIDAGRGVAIVDVREPDEFTGPLGHIAGSRNIPMSAFESRLGELAEREATPLVLVCRTDKRSAKAAGILRGAGVSDVSVLRKGMEQWNDSGFPVESGGVGAENDRVLR